MEPFTTDELYRQVRAHLQSLRRAGVDWLPAGSPLPWTASKPKPRGESSSPEGQSKRESASPAGRSAPSVPPAPHFLETPMTPDPVSTLSRDERRQALTLLAAEVKKCTKCAALCSTRTQTVFGDGGPGVELCFIGEAPGADEDAQGLPFVGAAGQLLNKIIQACGLKREEVYICNIIKCRPPANRTPLPNEAANCRDFLERQLQLVQPKYICALGGCAATNLLGTTLSLGKLRGKLHDYHGIPVLVTYHPAYLLPHRNPGAKKDVWEDMKFLLTAMGRPIPKT